MFDPSKLDLDLDEKKKEESVVDNTEKQETAVDDTEKKSDQAINDSEKVENEKTINAQDDVLENLDDSVKAIPISETPEDNSILEELITPDEKKDINENEIWKTEYEKSITKTIKKEESNEIKSEKIIFDINVTSIDIILSILIEKKYDFATFEPSEEAVKIEFRKDKAIKETRYIKYPIYSNILIKAKAISKLTIEETNEQQEWEWRIVIKNENYKITTKVVPTNLWAKLFIKTKVVEKKLIKKSAKKFTTSKILTIIWAIAFITLVIWWAFLSFVILNAKTIDDVKFFYSLWINLNDINDFMSQAIAVIFSILIFIETLFLIIFLFKFVLTKKEFKKKKIKFWIISTAILILAFTTWSTWMIIDQKIRALPNWQEEARWDVQLYDNSKLLSEYFSGQWAFLEDTTNLIWPIEIKFNLTSFAKKEERKWFEIKKYIWNFWDGKIVETPIPTIIHNFKDKWNYKVKLIIEEKNLQWEIVQKEMENIPNINLSYVVKIDEKLLNNWWKLVEFDASDLIELGDIEWYFIEDLDKPVWTRHIFKIWKPIFEETLIGMYVKRSDKKSEELDKIFIIKGEEESSLDWNIKATRTVLNDLKYELIVENLYNDFWNWYIEEFKWIIWDKEVTNIWDITNPEESSKIIFEFKEYWKHDITVIIKDSIWETKEITTTIDIPKRLKLSKTLQIYNDWKLINNIKYQEKLNEYYINELWVPTSITLDARFIKSDDLLYTLDKVDWDYDSDWDIDQSSKLWNYDVSIEWNHTITAYYKFINRKIEKDVIILKEQIFIEWLKKEAIVDFDITKKSDYVPVIVWFDASKSQVKGENIEKFIWDYGDGITEERDAIVPWHRYTAPWDYIVKLKVITTNWKEFSFSKKLILKPKPQSVKISTSMKKAPIWQGIDFSSEESEGQIIWYFWNFWDGETSTEANPTHAYRKSWTYEISLKVDFSNKNILEDIMNIEIYKK